MWYDELLTFHVSGLQPFSLFWSALKAGVDAMPLAYYSFVRLARMLPGDPHVLVRLPSIFGYLLTLLGVYLFTRKKLPAPAGLAAALLVALSPFREYALEARSYALLVGFLAIASVFWQRIGEKRFMTPLFALFLILAVSCHYLSVVVISAFGVAELTFALLSRRIRWGVWTACLLATLPFFTCLPILLHIQSNFGKHFWSHISWREIVWTYGFYLGLDPELHSTLTLALITFFGMVVGASLLRRYRTAGEESPVHNFSPAEIMLAAGFLYYPALLVALTKLLRSGYVPRYGWPAILGIIWGSVYLVRSIWLKSASVLLLVALLLAFTFQDARRLALASSSRLDERWTRLADVSRSEPGIPVVIGSATDYLEAVEYLPPDLRDRLVEVFDADILTGLIGMDTADKTNRLLAQFVPLHVEDLGAFLTVHPKFILRSGGFGDWVPQYLVESRYSLRLISRGDDNPIYMAER